MNCNRSNDDGRGGVSRRTLLSGLTLGLGAAVLAPRLSLRRALAGGASDPTFLVVINMFGGNDSLNTYVPHGFGAYYDLRPRVGDPVGRRAPDHRGRGAPPVARGDPPALRGGATSRSCGRWGIPTPISRTSRAWTSGARACAPSRRRRDPRGWIGRAADLYFPGALDVVGVGVGRRPDFVANTAKPLVLDGLGSYGAGQSAVPWWELEHRDAAAKAMLAAGSPAETAPGKDLRKSLRNAYDLVDVIKAAEESYTTSVTYPDEYFASRLQDVARLVKARLGGRIFYTGLGGFDTHSDQAGQHAGLLSDLGAALAAFQQDLESMGAWDRAAIVVISEFGRRIYDNASAGTDHGHGLLGARRWAARSTAASTAPRSTGRRSRRTRTSRARSTSARSTRTSSSVTSGVDPNAGVFPEAWTGDQRVPLFG